jgi:hypothetical protein
MYVTSQKILSYKTCQVQKLTINRIDVSGGAFNPAILMGLNIVDALDKGLLNRLEFTWIYLVGGFLGGTTAGILFWFTNRYKITSTASSSIDEPNGTKIVTL